MNYKLDILKFLLIFKTLKSIKVKIKVMISENGSASQIPFTPKYIGKKIIPITIKTIPLQIDIELAKKALSIAWRYDIFIKLAPTKIIALVYKNNPFAVYSNK